MKLWLDDQRPPPKGWIWAKTVPVAIELMNTGQVVEASLDHDLGEGNAEGYALCLWMAEHDIWPTEGIAIHSANAPGADRITGVIKRYGPYRQLPGRRQFVRE
jgi:hypothetical protein